MAESRPDDLPRAVRLLWEDPTATRRSTGLTRERIVDAAIELADVDGIESLSMARLAERLGCGTMSLYRHVANKDELVVFMLSAAAGPPPSTPDSDDWRAALTRWASGLWDVYHRHPWVLRASAAGPPVDPGQLAWFESGLAALGSVALSERDKASSVVSMLYYVRGAAGLAVESGIAASTSLQVPYGSLLRRVIDSDRFPALSVAVDDGAFDDDDNPRADFDAGVRRVLDGIASQLPDS